jgi:hypothetical protein
MTNFFESESFDLPSQVKNDVASRLKETKGILSVELQLKGDSMEGGKEFSRILLGLKKRGVKISHEFSIKLDFPRSISRERALTIVENMPKPKNGTLKVRIETTPKPSAAIKS